MKKGMIRPLPHFITQSNDLQPVGMYTCSSVDRVVKKKRQNIFPFSDCGFSLCPNTTCPAPDGVRLLLFFPTTPFYELLIVKLQQYTDFSKIIIEKLFIEPLKCSTYLFI